MHYYGSLINVGIQFIGLFSVQYLGLNWAIIPTAILLSIIIVLQTISAGALFSRFVETTVITSYRENIGMRFLVAFLYGVSVYQIFLLGYVFFAGVATVHVLILIMSLIFLSIKGNK